MGVGVQGPPGNRHGCARAPVQQQTGDVHTGSVQQGAGVQGLAHNSFTVCKDTCAMGAGVQGCLCPRRAGTSVQRDRWRAARCQDRCPTQHLECGQVCNGGGCVPCGVQGAACGSACNEVLGHSSVQSGTVTCWCNRNAGARRNSPVHQGQLCNTNPSVHRTAPVHRG